MHQVVLDAAGEGVRNALLLRHFSDRYDLAVVLVGRADHAAGIVGATIQIHERFSPVSIHVRRRGALPLAAPSSHAEAARLSVRTAAGP